MIKPGIPDELRDYLVESEAAVNWAWIIVRHGLGLRLQEIPDDDLPALALTLRKRLKTLNDCKAIAKRWPDVDSLPIGKEVNWHRLCVKFNRGDFDRHSA